MSTNTNNLDINAKAVFEYLQQHSELLQQLDLPLNASLVEQYLQANPDFFLNYPDLINALNFPHACGNAESLLLYQIKTMRAALLEKDIFLHDLMRLAEDNHAKLATIQKLILELLDSPDNPVLFTNLQGRLRSDMGINETKLFCYKKFQGLPVVDTATAKLQLSLLQNAKAGMLYLDEENSEIFNLPNLYKGSAALCRLEDDLGLLVLAHADKEHFTPDQDTLFIEYLSSILSRLLQRDHHASK